MIVLAPRAITIDARKPLVLPRHGPGFVVEAGVLDLFARAVAPDGRLGARIPLTSVEAGGFVGALGPTAGADIAVFAGGGVETKLRPLSAPPDLSAIETWITRLLRAIEADWPRPAGIDPKRSVVAPQQGVGWFAIDGEAARVFDTDLEWRSDLVALASPLWLTWPEAAPVGIEAVIPSCDAALRALAPFHDLVLALVSARITRALVGEHEALRRRAALLEGERQAAMVELAMAASGSSTPSGLRSAWPVGPAPTPARAACRALFAHLKVTPPAAGADIVEGAVEDGTTGATMRAVETLLERAGVRARRVILRAGWWRSGGDALIAIIEQTGAPVVLCPRHRGGYDGVDPVTGSAMRVDEALALRLQPMAIAAYGPFDRKARSVGALAVAQARHVMDDVARVLIAAFGLGLVALVPPIMTQILIDGVIPNAAIDELVFCAAAMLATAIGIGGLKIVEGVVRNRVAGQLDLMLQTTVMDRLLRLPLSFFRHYTVGDLTERIFGIDQIRQTLTGRAFGALAGGVAAVFALVLMILYDPKLAVLGLSMLVFYALMIARMAAVRLGHERRHFEANGRVGGLVLQCLAAVGKLRGAGATARAFALWSRIFGAQKHAMAAAQRASAWLDVFAAGFSGLAALALFALAAPIGQGGQAGAFLAFFAAFGQAVAATTTLASVIGESLLVPVLAARARPILTAVPEPRPERLPARQTLRGSIALMGVTFRYAPGAPAVFDGLDLSIEAGSFTALVGPSGCGKSTILRLILGFERPEAGRVLFDGRAIESFDPTDLRRQIGVVLQTGRLLSGSIFENVACQSAITVEQAWEALRFAALDQEVEALPMGLHTVLTEGVATLSGGQIQRLLIARALVHRPRLLLFDEATSALDNRTQATISSALAKLDVTRVVIAHRLSTIAEADQILVLHHGRVVQRGRFEELRSVPGSFADLAGRQLL